MDDLLKHYREGIDTLDRELVYLFSRRFEYVKQIGILKKEIGITNPLDSNRWEKVLENIEKEAKDKGVSLEFIKKIWDEIHLESLKIEK